MAALNHYEESDVVLGEDRIVDVQITMPIYQGGPPGRKVIPVKVRTSCINNGKFLEIMIPAIVQAAFALPPEQGAILLQQILDATLSGTHDIPQADVEYSIPTENFPEVSVDNSIQTEDMLQMAMEYICEDEGFPEMGVEYSIPTEDIPEMDVENSNQTEDILAMALKYTFGAEGIPQVDGL